MRACLATLLGLTLGLSPLAAHASASGSPSLLSMRAGPEADKAPEVLYEEGKKAYRLGRFGEAVQKWERAYDLSERSLLLYNISLAYKGLYGISGEVDDLRKARAVMNNFFIIAQADPDIDPDDAEERIAELDTLIADAEASETPPDPGETMPGPADEPKPLGPQGPDPGRTLRIAGAANLGVGGLLTVTGAVMGIYFGVRGQEFSDELRQLQAGRPALCDGNESSTDCLQQDANIETARNNGRKANLGLGLGLGIGGGLGIVALSAGAILFVQGNRKTADWKSGATVSSMRLVPTGRGLALVGRF